MNYTIVLELCRGKKGIYLMGFFMYRGFLCIDMCIQANLATSSVVLSELTEVLNLSEVLAKQLLCPVPPPSSITTSWSL